MSKQNKWAGNYGKVASGGSATSGGNTGGQMSKVPAPVANSNKWNNVIMNPTGPGNNLGKKSGTTHNDINAFTRGIKSRGPYTGPSFRSLNNSYAYMQLDDTSRRSAARNPSSGVGEFTPGNSPKSGSASTPVGGPSSRSINNSYRILQSKDTSGRSKFNLPSQQSHRAGGSTGTGLTKSPDRTGSGSASGTRTSGTRDNKNGSGYQASVRGSK